MTLGPVFIILSLTENLKGKLLIQLASLEKFHFSITYAYISNSSFGSNNCMVYWFWMGKLDY